ncbi:uncharacterized protein LOC116308106 [Actinia tenebrosa]|uniref:Uncharacterized protein LOC116308106 n=1 Tax=Actinia tenebrosa TaxID=6105 RepID=A0A6P8JCM8_ACTTE|nr:uncharacterized protein LOC116308106 [Actinia tenebrosa]
MDVRKFFVLLSLDAVLVIFFYAHSSEGFLWWGSEDKKVDGKWSAWSSYSSCQIPSSKDSYPYRFKQRSCTNPAPKNGGKSCTGQSRRNAPCSDCDTPLGMENNRIDDSQVTASTFHEEFPPHEARLNGPSAWCAGDLSGEVYLQVDLQRLSLITAVATQGFYPDPKKISLRLGSVSKYRITFSDDGTLWEVHQNRDGNHSVFNGNKRNSKTVLNIFEPNIAARYVRIVPTARLNFACMKLELYGCKFKCGGYLPQSPGDLLAASLETENIDCFWQVHLPKSTKINFDFINFDLPCSIGQVEIRGSGSSYGRSQLLGHLCDHTSAPPPVVSNGNKMWIRFQSNSSDPLIGIYGTYFPNCDYQYNSSEGALMTPNFPKNYNHNSLCKWLISVPKGKAIKLTFFDFEVEGDQDNGPKCLNDYVIVMEGNASRTEIGRFCNTNKPPKHLCSYSNRIEIQFKSDDILSFKGFNALYKAKEPNAPCVEPSSTMITPSPTISIYSSTIASLNYSSSAILRIIPTATIAISSTVNSNSSIGIPGTRPGPSNVMGQGKKDGDDDNDDNGLTTIIIISVFSFIVLLMIIASVIPSMIHGYEKRKRERDWLAAADPAEKKNGIGNGYEMQPMKSSVNVDKEKPEPNETTAFLDPEHGPPDNDITDNAVPYPILGLKDKEEIDGSVTEDVGCDLEYDPTDLNLNVSYEDLGTSFATEMTIMMNHISPGKERSEPYELPKSEDDDNSTDIKAHENNTIENNNDHNNLTPQDQNSQDTLENGTSEDYKEPSEFACPEDISKPDEINSAKVVAGIQEKNDKLQKALNDLKATLTQVNSDSGSIPEIQNPDTCTNSTVSVRGSQEIDNMPPVDIINPIWERNATNDPGRKRLQEEYNENKHGTDDSLSVPGNDKDSGHYSSNNDHSTLGTETIV